MKSIVRIFFTMLAGLGALSCGDAPPLIADAGEEETADDETACETGSLDCVCYGNDTCDLNLTCAEGICVDERVPPNNPKCYTPCKTGAVLDGVYRSCSEDGLMDGCIDGAICINGSCVRKVLSAPVDDLGDGGVSDGGADTEECMSDSECPGFQTCIQFKCYSDCELDEECPDGKTCYLRVCRPTCDFDEATCPSKSYCDTADGETGNCMPMASAGGEQQQAEGSFLLSTDRLNLSNMKDSAAFTVINNGPMPLKFYVRKVKHTEFTDKGPVDDTEMPLFWTSAVHGDIDACEDGAQNEDGGAVNDDENVLVSVLIEGNGAKAILSFCNAANENLPMWNGIIEVGNDALGWQQIRMDYTSDPDGQWAGKIYYFANFGTDNLDGWLEDKNSESLASVGNALIWRWAAVRRGQITLDNFMAALQSTKTGSWSWATVEERCPEPMGACYPYSDYDGMESFSNDIYERPIPSGIAELPVSLNLRMDPDDDKRLIGRINSEETMHYAGDPAISFDMETATNGCAANIGGACLNYIANMSAEVVVGGRYLPDDSDTTCKLAEDFEPNEIPWLVPGFTRGVYEDAATGMSYRRECRDTLRPFDNKKLADLNASLAGSNPIPDGRSRIRRLEIIDGAMINQDKMMVIFKEVFADGADDEDANQLVAYGIMQLARQPTTLDYNDFDGSVQTEDREQDEGQLAVQCSESIVEKATGLSPLPEEWTPVPIDSIELGGLVWALVEGMDPSAGGTTTSDVGEAVHYLCHDTGLLDGGGDDDGLPGAEKVVCPEGSRVTFFAIPDTCRSQTEIAALPCQDDGTCGDTLGTWSAVWENDPSCSIRVSPFWRCTDPEVDYCDDDRTDLRDGKTFFAASANAPFLPIKNSIDNAFRYKTAFQNRQGTNLGFSPDVCVPNSNSVPYCYDPGEIEEIEDRVSCALDIFVNHRDRLGTEERDMLAQYLTINFSVEGTVIQKDGFEAFFSELLIMLGDEAYTTAFASRFDLAGIHTKSFEGELFETDGINLSGVAGQEMYSLYQAIQYYQMALDRFYTMLPLIRVSLEEQTTGSSSAGFITQETVTNYLDRLIRASTQKSRVWSEVSKRYQNFNRADLARLVIERAYTATYMESVLITRMMHKVTDVVRAADEAQILMIIDTALKRYKAELLDMRDIYKAISDDLNYFGYPPEYIPFPAMDPLDINAFEKLFRIAEQKAAIAKEKEYKALTETREFDTNTASFQSELVRIRNTYESQLTDLCGVFYDGDGNPLPAITKYAYLYDDLAMLGDPCGYVGAGDIHMAFIEIDLAANGVKAALQRRENRIAEIENEMTRVSEQCDEIVGTKDYMVTFFDDKITAETIIGTMDVISQSADRLLGAATTIAHLIKCSPPTFGTTPSLGDCPAAGIAIGTFSVLNGVTTAISIAAAGTRISQQLKMLKDEKSKAEFELTQQCD
ncbi:MAG: hypothetical protein GY854_11985, partial [Deltaproteobacteria bacterium]|nr:hypothetical protein [Deltaproteobacteria bacterium]